MKNSLVRSVLCLLLMVSLVTVGDAANQSRIGTAGAQELLIPVGARGIAIGGSNMVFSTGVDAIFWNPAGLGRQVTSVEGIVSSMNYIADINVVYAGLGIVAGDFGTLGFTVKSISFGDIPVTTVEFPDGTGEQYSPTFITLGASFGKALTDRIAVGVTANLVSERILSMSATGMAINVGIQYQNLGTQGLDLGVTVKNLGTDLKFSGTNLLHKAEATTGLRGDQFYAVEAAANEMPSCLEIGLGYTHKFDEKNFAKVGGMFRNNNFQQDEYNLGAEYSFDNLFFLRGGYTMPGKNTKDPLAQREYIYDYTLGAGLHYNTGGLDLSFDYAYRHMKYFDASNIITLKVGL
jgi:hypothetical protein